MNLTRSTYLGDDIDQPKAEALARHLRLSCPSDDEMRVIRVAMRVATPRSNACSNAADFAAVRERSPLSESLALLRIRTLTNSDERAAEVWGLEGHRSPKCPAAVGCRRLSSVVVGYLWGMRT